MLRTFLTTMLTIGILAGPARAASHAPPTPPPSPTTTSAPRAPSPCTSTDCIPQPTPTDRPSPSGQPSTTQPDDAGGDSAPGGVSGWIAKGIFGAISSFFRGIVDAALNPLLDLLGRTLLTTPSPASLPRIGELWANSWQITLACYSLLVSVAGIVVMGHGTVQTSYSVREMAPRIPLGFMAAGLSLFLAGKAVDLANALSQAVMGDGVGSGASGALLHAFIFGALDANGGNLFFVLIGLTLVGTLVALLVCYVVRLALTVILIVGAPLALMCHALPQTEGIARWWWKAFGGVLAIQVVQSLALITALRLFLRPGGFTVFGPGRSGLVDLIVALALFYILFKIPFWILGSVRVSPGRSLVGGLIRGYITYRTFGALRGLSGGARGGAGSGGGLGPPSGGANSPGSGGPPRSPAPSGFPAGARARRGGGAGSRTASGVRRSPGPPLFLPPSVSASPDAAAPHGRAAGPPPMPEFRGPGDPPGNRTASTPRPGPRPSRSPGPPVFRAPTPAARASRSQPAGELGVRTGTPRHDHPATPHRPPPPTAFRAPVSETGATPLASRPTAPPPTTFRAPQPQRSGRRPAPPPSGPPVAPRRSGGEQR
ncbi:hypothetical protein [Streptomyces sp. NPDC102360]|uniref:hypothetical protein n=1 Tax=Streptomyces sp. NPDC102360 TaxID=3366160 RepID=UPI0038110661